MINSAGHLLILVFLRFALLPYLSYRGFPPNLAYYARWQLGTLLYVNLGQTRPYRDKKTWYGLVRVRGHASWTLPKQATSGCSCYTPRRVNKPGPFHYGKEKEKLGTERRPGEGSL